MQKVFKNGFLMMSLKRSEKTTLVDLKKNVKKISNIFYKSVPLPLKKIENSVYFNEFFSKFAISSVYYGCIEVQH